MRVIRSTWAVAGLLVVGAALLTAGCPTPEPEPERRHGSLPEIPLRLMVVPDDAATTEAALDADQPDSSVVLCPCPARTGCERKGDGPGDLSVLADSTVERLP